jgi:hypothetical protein
VDISQPKNRWQLGRVARLAFRTLTLATLAALIFGWVVSYRAASAVQRYSHHHVNLLNSYCGHVQFSIHDRQRTELEWAGAFVDREATLDEMWRGVKPFELRMGERDLRFQAVVPYWFLSTLAAFAVTLSFKRTWRFTMRQFAYRDDRHCRPMDGCRLVDAGLDGAPNARRRRCMAIVLIYAPAILSILNPFRGAQESRL